MHDLGLQIRNYVDATSEPVSVDDVLHVRVGEAPVRTVTERSVPMHRNRGWLIAGTTGAIVLVTVGLIPLLLRSESSAPSGTNAPVTTTVPIEVTDPSIVEGTNSFTVQTEGLGPLTWTRFEAPDGDTPVLVTTDPDGGYVAHMWSNNVMHSDDGAKWQILPADDAAAALDRIDTSYVPPESATLPNGIIPSGPQANGSVSLASFGYVASGGLNLDTPYQRDIYGNLQMDKPLIGESLWLSVDGAHWELLQTPPPLDDSYGFVGGAAHGATGDLIFWSEAAEFGSVLWIGRFGN